MIVRQLVKQCSVAAAGIVLGAASLGAYAQGEEYMVTYSTSELSTPSGVINVHERIVRAAKQYCPTYAQIRSRADVDTCVEGVVEDLVGKVDHPQLTSLHESGSAFSIAEVPMDDRDRS